VPGLIQSAADIDELQRFDDPAGQRLMNEVIEMGPPGAAFFDEAVRAQQGKVLGNPRGGQGQGGCDAGDILFAAAQLGNQPQPVRMSQQLEQVRQLARDDYLAGHGKLAGRVPEMGVWPGMGIVPEMGVVPDMALDLRGMAPPDICKYVQIDRFEGMPMQRLSQMIPTSSAHDTSAPPAAQAARGA
jgi:hypothetical protein